MTIVQHGAHGAVIGYILTKSISVCVIFGFLGMLPDVVGWYGRVKNGTWDLYIYSHKFHVWELIFLPIFIHVLIDKYWHNPNYPYGWYSWGKYAEVIGWVITIYVSYIIFI